MAAAPVPGQAGDPGGDHPKQVQGMLEGDSIGGRSSSVAAGVCSMPRAGMAAKERKAALETSWRVMGDK